MKNDFLADQIEKIISKNEEKELVDVVYSLGRDCENDLEFEYVLSKLKFLANHKSLSVRANVILAFSMLIRNQFIIEKNYLENLILKTYREARNDEKSIIEDSVEDINLVTNWGIKLK